MNKRSLIDSKIDRATLVSEANRVGREEFSTYDLTDSEVQVVSMHQALTVLFADAIANETEYLLAAGKPYVDLTSWDLLEDDELLFVYDIESNRGRRLTEKELNEWIQSNGTSLTPSGVRRWYENRKTETEFLVSDFEALTFWVVED